MNMFSPSASTTRDRLSGCGSTKRSRRTSADDPNMCPGRRISSCFCASSGKIRTVRIAATEKIGQAETPPTGSGGAGGFRGTCKINLDFSEGGAAIPSWAVSHGETTSLNQCRRCSWALWTACRHTSGQPFTQLGLRIRPLASQAGASESRDALMPLQRRIWSAVSARIRARGDVPSSLHPARPIVVRSFPWRGGSYGRVPPSAPSELRARRRARQRQAPNRRPAPGVRRACISGVWQRESECAGSRESTA